MFYLYKHMSGNISVWKEEDDSGEWEFMDYAAVPAPKAKANYEKGKHQHKSMFNMKHGTEDAVIFKSELFEDITKEVFLLAL